MDRLISLKEGDLVKAAENLNEIMKKTTGKNLTNGLVMVLYVIMLESFLFGDIKEEDLCSNPRRW